MGIKIQSKKKIDFVTDVTPRVPTAGTFFVCKNGVTDSFNKRGAVLKMFH